MQTLEEHLENVAKLCSQYSKTFGAEGLGYICGTMHDIGKYSIEFQDRLLRDGKKVDHSTAGARETGRLFGNAFKMLLGYVICGHHSGLMDYGSEESGLMYRFSKEIPKYIYGNTKLNLKNDDLIKEIPRNKIGCGGFTIAFFIRMLYSCLVDADFLDTEKFMQINKADLRGFDYNFSNLILIFDKYMQDKIRSSEPNKINSYRQQILNNCIETANQDTNLFSLTVPTGGGKTLASMAFALKHLKHNELQRIICVIPYTSIIEQNARQYKDIFGENIVLEHHSNFDLRIKDGDTDEENYTTSEKLKLSSENWDIPIIITTNVQFFESLFSNKSSKCRKLHNIANSIIIIDEAQMIPTKFLKPSLAAISELVENYNTSIVLTTATNPKFPKDFLSSKPIEIANDPVELYEEFRRVKVEYIDQLSDAELSMKVKELDQVLIIVNTRNHAQKLYESLPKENLFHLSGKMCSAHRSYVLEGIKEKLKNRETCKVISTQLIECGVDISFPVVYRSLTGIDSIVQSAGRCNREGELDVGEVYVFNSTEQYGKAIAYQSRTAECGRQVLRQFSDPLSIGAVSDYFRLLYDVERDRLDSKGIMEDFEEGAKQLAFNFEKAAKDYRLIEDTESLIIPYNEDAYKLINALKYAQYPLTYIRRLQPYIISIHKIQIKSLIETGVISIIADSCYLLDIKTNFYDENTGLVLDNNEILII